jgi:hypothetical protein
MNCDALVVRYIPTSQYVGFLYGLILYFTDIEKSPGDVSLGRTKKAPSGCI